MDMSTNRLHRAGLICPAIVFATALLLYISTLAPTVTLVDSGELIVCAYGLGVAHPPGFPLWVMLAHLATLVPWGNVAGRVNFSSALFAALASAMLALVVAELMNTASCTTPSKRKRKTSKTAMDPESRSIVVIAPALGAGLLLAFSRTLWFYATITEVYALNTLLVVAIFFLMLRWRRCIVVDRKRIGMAIEVNRGAPTNTGHDSLLYLAAFLFGLALGDHHVTVGLTLPAIGIVVYRTEGLRFFLSRRLIYAALISIAGLIAVYSYLPWAASRSPILNWGEPRSFQEIWWHITGRQYQVFISLRPEGIGEQFRQFVRFIFREFGYSLLPLPLFLAFCGFVRAFKTDRTAFWFLLVIIVASMAYNLSYEIAEDKDAYYLPTFVAIAIAAGYGIRWLIECVVSNSIVGAKRHWLTTIILLIAPAMAFIGNWPFNNRSHYLIAHDYVENIFAAMKPNGLLLTQDWQVVSPMFYVQEIEHQRHDAKIVDVNLLRRSWYFDYLRQAYPDLVERSREKIDAFVAELKQWDRDPAAYARDPQLTLRINTAFMEMIQAMVTNESRLGPVYLTNDLISTNTENSEVTKWISQSYQLVPEGLIFELVSDQNFRDPGELHLQTRGLADGTLQFEKDDVLNNKVLPSYTAMLVNRGRYLAHFDELKRAIDSFQEALALDPSNAAAEQGLEESVAKLRKK
jgi:Protein O-mannosyl-transferase TMEM260-like